MPTITVANDFFEDVLNGVHDLSNDTIRLVLSNTAPASETSNPLANGNGVLTNITQVSYSNYTDDLTVDRVVENLSVALAGAAGSGVATFDFDDIVITASGGAIAQWQYAYFINDTATNDEVIAVVAEDAAVDIGDGESHTITMNASGLLTLGNAA